MKFITNRIYITAKEEQVVSYSVSNSKPLFQGKHLFQDGKVFHGTEEDFAPHQNIFSPLTPMSSTTAPSNVPHVRTMKPDHGSTFNTIMEHINSENGKPMLVGGFPRDWLLGKDSKDKDVEVYNMDSDKLTNLLSKYGNVNAVGASFGVIKLKTPDGQDYDFSMPRRENKVGQGYKGFQVAVDPSMTPEDAASRRDFTFNSLMQDPLTHQIHDYHGGLEDLKNGVLRATSEKYAEDPLRVLRGMQFAGRMGLTMDPDTANMSKGLSNEYHTLSKDRIMTEWQKFAEKSKTPSKGLQVLQDTDWIKHYPELQVTPEKMKAIDNMALKLQSKEHNFDPEDKNVLFFAALTHDMKPEHVTSFLDRIGMPLAVRKRVQALRKGLDSSSLHGPEVTPASVRHTANHVSPESTDNLMHVIEATRGKDDHYKKHHDLAQQFGVHKTPPAPIVNGDFLQKYLGMQQGPEIGQAIKDAYRAQLDGEISTPADAMNFFRRRNLT